MNIVLVTGVFPLTSESFIEQKAIELTRRGHRVTVIAHDKGSRPGQPLWASPEPHPLKVFYLPLDSSIKRLFRMFLLLVRGLVFEPAFVLRMVPRILRSHGWGRTGWDTIYKTLPFAGMKPAVVHFEFVYEATLYDGVLDSFDVPHLVSCRGDEDLVAPFIVERAVEEVAAALKRATEIHAVSRHTLEVARKAGAPGDKGVVINPAIPIDHFPARQRTDYSGPTRLVAVGRLMWTKGHEHLLKAIRLLLDRGMEVSCQIVGDGGKDEVNELLHTAQRLELGHAVTLLGAVPRKEVAELLARSDIFVLPSLFEGLSNACIEAMATGLPVVVTDVGGMSELVTDGVDGFVVPPEDPAALAERIGKLIDDPTLAERFGSSGRARVKESFRLEDQLDAFEKVYSRLAGLRRER